VAGFMGEGFWVGEENIEGSGKARER